MHAWVKMDTCVWTITSLPYQQPKYLLLALRATRVRFRYGRSCRRYVVPYNSPVCAQQIVTQITKIISGSVCDFCVCKGGREMTARTDRFTGEVTRFTSISLVLRRTLTTSSWLAPQAWWRRFKPDCLLLLYYYYYYYYYLICDWNKRDKIRELEAVCAIILRETRENKKRKYLLKAVYQVWMQKQCRTDGSNIAISGCCAQKHLSIIYGRSCNKRNIGM